MLPLLSGHLACSVDSVLWQPLLAQEMLLCNLLEVALYHQHACEALSEDAALELCDYCSRKLVLLNTQEAPPAQGRQSPDNVPTSPSASWKTTATLRSCAICWTLRCIISALACSPRMLRWTCVTTPRASWLC